MTRLGTNLILVVAAFAAGFGVRGCVGGDAPDAIDGRPAAASSPDAGDEAPAASRARPPARRAASQVPAPATKSEPEATADAAPPSELIHLPAEARPVPDGSVTIRGRCVDSSGAPVARVAVHAASPFAGSARTGDDGRFEIHGIASEWRYLRIVPPAELAPRRIPLPAPADGRVDVGDVVLSAGGTIRGVFLDMDGRPVAGAPLLLHDIDASCSARGGVITDREGRFVIEHVPEGRVCVSGRSPGAPLPAPEQDAQLWEVRAGDEIVLRIRSRNFVRFEYVDEAGATVRIAGPRVRWFALDDASEGETWEWEGGWWSACQVPVRPGARYEIQFEIDGWLPITHRFEGGEETLKRETLVFRRAAR